MAGIRKWIRGKLHSKPQRRERKQQPVRQHIESLPYLPATRPRPLTRGSAGGKENENENEEPASSRFLQNYGLFGRLPHEIRRQVLTEAFGERTLHMDLSYRHPLVRKPKPQNAESSTGSGVDENAAVAAQRTHRHCDLGSELVLDTSQPLQWQWFGCVCHRRAGPFEITMEWYYTAIEKSLLTLPCDDECLEGSELMCSCQAEQAGNGGGAACFVGAMGWLLSCRQAYADGIDVLYSTNTFHLSSLDLQLNLPRLIPPHHLEKITSLELLWKLTSTEIRPEFPLPDHVEPLWDAFYDTDPNFQDPDSPLHILCQMIPQTFPRLRRLYISFQCWLRPPSAHEDTISDIETIFLGPVEDMMQAYLLRQSRQGGHTQGYGNLELNVAIQMGAWDVLLDKYHQALGAKLRVQSDDDLNGPWRGRLWRPLRLGSGAVTGCGGGSDGGDDAGGGTGVEENNGDGPGYWICSGWQDTKEMGSAYWQFVHWSDWCPCGY